MPKEFYDTFKPVIFLTGIPEEHRQNNGIEAVKAKKR
jgi:hypothetical protein